jgi:hypothetical protein
VLKSVAGAGRCLSGTRAVMGVELLLYDIGSGGIIGSVAGMGLIFLSACFLLWWRAVNDDIYAFAGTCITILFTYFSLL